MIDQCVRKESGGELIKWYKNTQIDPDLMHYVHKRTGYLLVTKINKRSNFLLKIRNLTWRSAYVKAQNEYAKILIKLLPKKTIIFTTNNIYQFNKYHIFKV